MVEVGPVAHGGHCVARLDGQVVFVRHTLPGEQVRIRVTEDAGRYLRADAVEVLRAADGRVTPPCPVAGTCGGCDFQHVDPAVQRRLLGDVVQEQLRRLAGIDREVVVEEVLPVLGWRTRMSWAVDPDGRPGLRRHRSHEVVPLEQCPIAHPDLPAVLGHRWTGQGVDAVVTSVGQRLVAADAPVPHDLEVDVVADADGRTTDGVATLDELVHDRPFRVAGTGFWQVHPAAATTLVDAVLASAEVRPGDVVADLYAGVGLFTRFLAEAVGPDGSVVSVEADRTASRLAHDDLADLSQVDVVPGTTERALHSGRVATADVVVLDPPRTGAKRAIPAIAALEPRRIVYVACDPAALARDVSSLRARGYELSGLQAFALFPMTHHVECVATLDRA
ncbi:TRAM domain-containing protein [Aeromicrobium halocynthiae]|uniref:TRAM domain-containing protein n=1 Tax=Aeromicrobium halocynthiae TaxID=560557 RepID=A0ABN2VQ31_9ACTN